MASVAQPSISGNDYSISLSRGGLYDFMFAFEADGLLSFMCNVSQEPSMKRLCSEHAGDLQLFGRAQNEYKALTTGWRFVSEFQSNDSTITLWIQRVVDAQQSYRIVSFPQAALSEMQREQVYGISTDVETYTTYINSSEQLYRFFKHLILDMRYSFKSEPSRFG